ncbi:ig-like domain-containing protein [Caerostris darwini]|uniref:Ig-like domain-containing protein n=1 Tax=Caerostris darwini TaxID=1538125 RepID=A0AAV4SN73_9ARAC|nr:ig-like domain-containing protein [Caerostris darwini]
MQMPRINLEQRAQEEILKSARPKTVEEVEYPEMHAVIGSTVSLPCNLSPPSPDDSFSLVLWYRLDLPNPIYTLDARSVTAPHDATHFANKVLGGRARFNISTQRPSAASLTLENVSESDAGEYRCRVDFRRGRTLSWLVKLNVIVPTNSLVIKDKDNRTLSGIIGPYKEGSSLALICEAQGEIKLMISNIVESVTRDSLHPICSILTLAPMGTLPFSCAPLRIAMVRATRNTFGW